MKFKKILLSLLICLSCFVQAKNITISRLTCEMQEGLVVVEGSPRLGWVMESPENGTRQSAYEIDIREAFTGRSVWNSGKVYSSQSQLVSTKGADIRPDNSFNYSWRVRVWDETDTPSEWSSEAKFRAVPERLSSGQWIGAITRQNAHLPEGRKFHGGELKKPEVKAAWEAVDTLAKKSICLRRTFQVGDAKEGGANRKPGKKIVEATAYVCGLGFYEFSLNGKKVGNSEFAPLWSDYDKTVYYNTYDVTEQLRRGENVVGILLGNGFYNVQGGRYRKLQISFGPPTLLFELVINYEDGTCTTVHSDNNWKYDFSPVTFNCIYGGEDYDARREQKGWNQIGFDDSHWRPVVIQEAPKGILRPQMAAPVKIMERYDIQKVTKLNADQVASASVSTKRTVDLSAFVLDMGQNLAGFPEITVRGKRGQKVTLIVAEALTEEGACNQRQTGRQHYYEYTLKGEGDETWHPRFSYYGFRYIQVEGAVLKGQKNPQKLPVLKNIQSCFVYNSARKVSTFESSNRIFNAAHRLIEKAVRSNMQSVFTDCPHREKLGWLEQVHLNGPGLLYNYDLTAYAPQIMQNMADAQHSNGAMPTTAPEYVIFEGPGMDAFAESPEWGGSLVIFPFMYYETYGDDSLIKKYYPNMRRYVDYLKTRADKGILSFGLGDWYDYGDFRAGFSRNTPVPLVATAHYYMTVMYLVQAAKMVGNDFDIHYYTSLAQDIMVAFNKCFLHKDTAQYGTGSQCSNALPLFLQMTQDADEQGNYRPDADLNEKVFANLIKDVEAHGNRLTTGDVGNRYLIQTLARNGEHELIYKMFNHEEAPGYGFQLKFGATTLTEQWDPRQGSSWNHFMMGQIDEWFFNSLVGIRPSTTPKQGYQKFIIAPQPIMEDKDGNLWFSTKGNGLVKAEPDMNSPHGLRFTRYINDPKNPNSISNNDVYFTYQDSQGRIWVGLLGGGLNLISEENGAITFIHKYNGLKQYPAYGLYMEVRTMTEDEDGRIWVGTMDGLMSFDGHFTVPEQIQFETYRQVSENSNVADNDIYVLYKDTDSQIWVSVFGGGLNRLVRYDKEKREPIFKSYGIREGMNNDVVKSIVEDKNGNLWFTTEIGLSCFNKATEQFRNYDKYDGFLNVELEEGSALRTLNGDLWIGTRQGILTFSPDKLETLHTNYDTRIVDFKVSNRDLRSFRECPILKESITYAKAIELNYNQSMFTIEFAALNFYNQNRVSYRYILEGYEKEWHYNGKNRIASYTNVPPGDYTFRVETVDEANPELVSNCTLAITILPPWWLSWWATLIYVILGLAALYFSLRLAFFMLKMKNDIYIEQKVSEMKIKFFTNISHELRTPLTLIKGPIQELREREKLSPKGLQYVDLMEKNTNQMLQLVNQILDFRKIQNGKMRLHVSLIDFNEMIASFQKEFRVLSEENEISFTFQLPDEPIMVWADKEKMSIVIRNIISNAFKFTHSGGSIYITTGLTDDGKRCYVRVEDNGVGIPQNKLTEIFERFSQGENAKNSYYQGTGIGLALSKEIVNLHHGQIRAESPEGQGAVFIVELLMDKEHYRPSEVDFYVGDTETAPVSVEQDPVANAISEDGTEEEPEIDASLPTLLLVEDNKDLCQLIKLQLEDKFNIHIANNGVEGLKKVHLYHPDIVVTDQMMPEMDGLEMLQSIRKDFQISHIPVIILTAKNDEGAKTKAITLGANAYITKPFSKEYLLARIDQLLAERKLFRERIRQQMENQTTTEEDSYEQFLVKKDVQFLEKIHQVIEENMDDSDFNIDTIASGIGLSRSAFFKKLKSLTGLAPVDLVKEIRLNKSIELIKNTDLSVSEIAFAVGFKDSGYYSKCFRKKYNQSPREYMNEWRKGER